MNTRLFIILIALFIVQACGQSEREKEQAGYEKHTTTELNFKTNNFEDFSTINWHMLMELLKKNDPIQNVNLSIAYNKDFDENTTGILTGKTKLKFNE